MARFPSKFLVELEDLAEDSRRDGRDRVHLQPRLIERSHHAERNPDQAPITPIAKYLADNGYLAENPVQSIKRHECAGHVGVVLRVEQRALECQSDAWPPDDPIGEID